MARICLDFGTSCSKASVRLGAHSDTMLRPLRLGHASGAEQAYLTPSVVYIERDRVFLGPPALARAQAGVNAKRDPITSFKMLLSARDVEGTLALRLGPSVDPSRRMNHRDALVLYLAHLDQLIRAAVQADPGIPDALAEAPVRLSSPLWRGDGGSDRALSRLFGQGEYVSSVLGRGLVGPEGVSLDDAKAALQQAGAATPLASRFAGVVLEVHCAAAAYAAFAPQRAERLLVVDIGAGTTDIAGFTLEDVDGGVAVQEIRAARQCCGLAGDEVDQILVQLLMQKSGTRALEEQSRLWRALRLSVRDLKHQLFATGKCALRHEGRTLVLRRQALANSPALKGFCKQLAHTISVSLKAAASVGRQTRSGVSVCVAGGGANLPFIDAVLADAAKRAHVQIQSIERFDGRWSPDSMDQPRELAQVFSQMAISMGGAAAGASGPSLETKAA